MKVAALVLLLLAACDRDEIEIRKVDRSKPNDYNRTALLGAAQVLARTPRSPAAFRAFLDRVAELRDGFDASVAELAERTAVFAALPVLEAEQARPPAERLARLATTVWPLALEVEPAPGEAANAFLDRVCQRELARQCKWVVPELRAQMLGAVVWNRLRDRARAAHRSCVRCASDRGYTKALATYDERERQAGALAGRLEDYAHPRAWPVAGPNAAPLTDAPLFTLRRSGAIEIDGTEASGAWRPLLSRMRGQAKVLSVHLSPADRTSTLRTLLEDARAAGFQLVGLRVREKDYPYRLREYRLAVRGRPGKRVMVRGVDTIQVLVRALDAHSNATAPPVLSLSPSSPSQ